jgi:hypothetical protein
MTAFVMDPAPLQPLQPLQSIKSKKRIKIKKIKDVEGFKGFDAKEDAGGPKPFDPVDEYRALLDLTEDSRRGGRGRKKGLPGSGAGAEEDAYSELMAKEQRVLDTVDRVVNDAVEKRDWRSGPLSGMPVHEVAMRTMGALRTLWDDLMAAQSLKDVQVALLDPSRALYIGLALVALAVALSLAHAMSTNSV